MEVTRGNRLHIGFYGKRNVGKSTLFNLILGQNYSITSDVAGTTTDVNLKSMELLPIGPVTLMDCAGIDDTDTLGEKRIEKTLKTLEKADIAVFVCDYRGIENCDREFLKNLKIPFIIVINKTDIKKIDEKTHKELKNLGIVIETNSNDRNFFDNFKAALIKILPDQNEQNLLPMLKPNDMAILVIPIDKEAPKGRLILPQVQTLRNLLDNSCISIVCETSELEISLNSFKKPPKIVVTDSQAFKEVSQIVPDDIALTSFSILFAKNKGDLYTFYQGAQKIDFLKDNDKVLIAESCTHHAIEDDIGKVKIPNLVKQYTNKNIIFEHFSGCDFPKNLQDYSLIIHCGACMTNRTQVLNRIKFAQDKNVAITNYGIAIAKCLGILERAIAPFKN